MITVRLEYGGIRVQNTAAPGQVASTIERMADCHGIRIGAIDPYQMIAAVGRVKLTNQRAVFTVLSA